MMMMDTDVLKGLALETLTKPRMAAQKIMALHLSRDVLWSGLVLVAAINAIIYSFSLLLADASALPPLLRNPVIFFVIITGLQVLSVHAFYWTGRAIGGYGDLGELLTLLVWLQALQAVAQAITFVLMLVSPGIAQMVSFLESLLALWITVNFIAEALRLPGLWHAAGVLVLAAVGIAVGLMILAGLIGLSAMGVPANV
jgi:hypothetical protein